MARKKNTKLFLSKNQMSKYAPEKAVKLGAASSAGMAYRLLKNKVGANLDEDKKTRLQQTVTLGALAAGAAGVLAVSPSAEALESASIGVFTVASLDFITHTFGDKVKNTFGVSLGEVPQNLNVPTYIIHEGQEDFPAALPENNSNDDSFTDSKDDPLTDEIDKILSDIDNEKTDDNKKSDLAGVEQIKDKVFDKLN